MAFATGTATNFNDLLDKLVAFLTTNPDLVAAGQQYQVLFDQTLPYTSQESGGLDRRHVVFKAPGLSGLDQIFTAISTRANTANDYYNWRIMGGTDWNPAGITSTPVDVNTGLINRCEGTTLVLFWNQPMTYWFFANGRRWWIVAKVSTTYQSGGAGFVLPSCPPEQFPYPLALWGSHRTEATRWSDTSDWNQGILTGRSYLRMPSGAWTPFLGFFRNSGNGWNDDSFGENCLAPTGSSLNSDATSMRRLLYSRPMPGGEFPIIPVTFVSRFNTSATPNRGQNALLAEADGLFFVPVFNNGAEDTITIDGVQYIVFQTAHRSGAPYLFALRAN